MLCWFAQGEADHLIVALLQRAGGLVFGVGDYDHALHLMANDVDVLVVDMVRHQGFELAAARQRLAAYVEPFLRKKLLSKLVRNLVALFVLFVSLMIRAVP